MEWSTQQEAIFEWFRDGEGHLLVRARAGTGKTTTILEAITRAPEEDILVCAFNKEIQTELERRLRRPGAEAKTLNALGYRFVRENLQATTLDTIARAKQLAAACVPRGKFTWEQTKAITDIAYKVREIAPHADELREVAEVAERFDLLTGDDNLDMPLCRYALDCVRYACSPEGRSAGVIDFADQIFLPLRCDWVHPLYDMVVVDEAQDMSEAQLELARRSCVEGGRVVLVGDDRQAIYGFRGAAPDALDATKAALGAAELGLTVTYRCPKSVVALAQQIVPDFEAHASAPEGQVLDVEAGDIYGAQPGDFIVSRTNAPLAKLCLGLLARGTRARIRGRDVGAGVRKLLKTARQPDVAGLLGWLSGYSEREQAKLARCVADGSLTEGQAETKAEAVHDQCELIRALCVEADDLASVERRCDELFTDTTGPAVVLSTTHKIKGLEADRVWMLTATYAPHPKHGDSTEGANLRYVAITRAKQTLCRVPQIGARFRTENRDEAF
jgi:DNA helicase-2/ATP-dependent DNA helicase PcrA